MVTDRVEALLSPLVPPEHPVVPFRLPLLRSFITHHATSDWTMYITQLTHFPNLVIVSGVTAAERQDTTIQCFLLTRLHTPCPCVCSSSSLSVVTEHVSYTLYAVYTQTLREM